MNKNENGFSLVVVVIFMSIAALFIGYLMGSWLISFLVEDSASEIAEGDQNSAVINQQPPEPESSQQAESSQQEETEEINNTENNLTAPTEEELKIAPDQSNQGSTEVTAEPDQNEDDEAETAENTAQNIDDTGGFGVQIGAFSNYNNALSVRDKVIELGFQVVITDSSPHQVQVVGYQNRDQAESAAQELEAEGYPGFIVIRE